MVAVGSTLPFGGTACGAGRYSGRVRRYRIIDRLVQIAPLAILLCLGSCAADRAADGFVPIFDGQTLAGWKAYPERLAGAWSVADGAIQGTGLEDRLSYLVYAGDEQLGDFELKLSYRMLTDGNTGIEIRARRDTTGKRPFEGYHADLGHVGIGPEILGAWDLHFATRKEFPCSRGTRLVIDGHGEATFERIDQHVPTEAIRVRDWNRCRIVARGSHFRFFINGFLSAELIDGFDDGRFETGQVALQLHEKGTAVQFKEIALKRFQ